MSVNNLTNMQKFGLVIGILPGINFIAAITKFVYYRMQESKSKETARTTINQLFARATVEQTAEKVDESAKSAFQDMEEEITNLKWFALLQIIPLAGILFASLEYESLEKINKIFNTNVEGNDLEDVIPTDVVPTRQPDEEEVKVESVITLTTDTFDKVVREGKVAVLICAEARDSKIKDEFIKASGTFKSVNFASFDRETQKTPESTNLGSVISAPIINIYNNGRLQDSILGDILGVSTAYTIAQKIRQTLHVMS